MSQLFPASINIIARVTLLGGVLILAGLAGLLYVFVRSPYLTEVGLAKPQPIPFSHKQHVGGLGLDCRYCHSTVEETAFAAIPPTETCLGCHRQVVADAPTLEPLRASAEKNQPVQWVRVHNLADYVYFNHNIHINKGIGCESCHGRVDQMPVMAKAEPLHMDWCLACHRAPEHFVRPRDQVFTMGWQPPPNLDRLKLISEYGINVEQLDDCSICHR
jgi:hypothetical protein